MCGFNLVGFFFFFKQKTAYEMRISDWSSDVCSSDLSAWIGAIRAITPHLGQIEHFAHHAERAIGVRRLVGHFLHHRSHVRSLHILSFYTTKQRDDVAVDDALIAFLCAGLIALAGGIPHVLYASRSEESRVGKWCVSTGRNRWA